MKKIIHSSVLLLLTACAVGPDFESPDPPEIESYTEEPLEKTVATKNVQGGAAQEFIMDEDIPGDWWTLFRSPELNALIEHGLKNSPNLRAAMATLEQAEQNLRVLIGNTMYPDITASYTQLRQQVIPFGETSGLGSTVPAFSPLLDVAPPPFYLYTGSVNVSYTLDVFGGNRRAIEGLEAQVDYQRYELAAAYITLTSNIVSTAVMEASLRAQIAATKQIIEIQQRQLNINRTQLELGGIAKTAVLAQETQLALVLASLPPLEKNLTQTRNALAILVGDYPGKNQLPTFELTDLHLPSELPVSLPSDLIHQRPDIQASEALLHQATAQIGVETANLLPTFPITGVYGTQTGTFTDLFGPQSLMWNWQGQVLQTIFNGGANLAQRKAAVAAFEIAVAQYQISVLNALKNVSDTLKALETDAQALQATALAEASAKETLQTVQKQYSLGAVGYLNVINAEVQYHQAYISRIISEAARYSDTAALFQAMGGGWWHKVKMLEEMEEEVDETVDEDEDDVEQEVDDANEDEVVR